MGVSQLSQGPRIIQEGFISDFGRQKRFLRNLSILVHQYPVLNTFHFPSLSFTVGMAREVLLENGKVELAEGLNAGAINELASNRTVSPESTLSWVTKNSIRLSIGKLMILKVL